MPTGELSGGIVNQHGSRRHSFSSATEAQGGVESLQSLHTIRL